MHFTRHPDIEGQHAYLSASNYHWTEYDDDKFDRVYTMHLAALIGTQKHELAKQLIKLKQTLEPTGQTLNMYVNDCIGYRMEPEVTLVASPTFFGTADAIGFDHGILRVFDYKSGVTPAKVRQLEVYGALFCLQYDVKPFEIEFDFRLYQNDDIDPYEGDPDLIQKIMLKGMRFSDRISELRKEFM